MSAEEKIVLGIDPGTNIMGYGLVLAKGSQLQLIQYGVIHLSKYTDHGQKLRKIHERVGQLIDQYHPQEVALEAPFQGKNAQSMLKLGRAQGAAMLAALTRGLPICEYAPSKIKLAVTGNGLASKEQVARMLMQLLRFKTEPEALLDATDALGVAVCHIFQKGDNRKRSASWGNFLSENPDRIVKKR